MELGAIFSLVCATLQMRPTHKIESFCGACGCLIMPTVMHIVHLQPYNDPNLTSSDAGTRTRSLAWFRGLCCSQHLKYLCGGSMYKTSWGQRLTYLSCLLTLWNLVSKFSVDKWVENSGIRTRANLSYVM